MKFDFKVQLAALDSRDCEQIRRWRNDYSIWRWCRQNDLISDVEQETWFERQSKDPTIKMYKILAFVDHVERTVGVGALTSIDQLNQRAEFSLYIAPSEQRKGYGTLGLQLLLEHGFKNLNLRQIWGESFEGNPALLIFDKLGFKLDGTRKQFYWKDGKFLDAHLISLTREEWYARSNSIDRGTDPSDVLPDNVAPIVPDQGRSQPADEVTGIKGGTEAFAADHSSKQPEWV